MRRKVGVSQYEMILILTAAECGFKAAEKGHNLEQAIAEIRKLFKVSK